MGKFYVHDLTGHRVFLVEPDDISHSTESHLVSAVMTQTNEIAPGSYTLDECAADGWVLIQLGEKVLEFRGLACTERPCDDVSGVATPRTHPSDDTIGCAPMAEDEDSMDEEMKKADTEARKWHEMLDRAMAKRAMSRQRRLHLAVS